MFDIGFWELCIIAVVALLILGPERLPIAARTAGLWIGKARNMISNVKSEIDRELQLDEVRKRLTEEETKLRESTGFGDLEILASNSIADIENFEQNIDTEFETDEPDQDSEDNNSATEPTDPKKPI